jgi:catechol 2,3-dioxygenase-like lactoylglutathione lyase family enzyme
VSLHPPVPVLRMFDEAAARAFWLGFLGFSVVFEHRFEPGMPLYMGIARDGCVVHLSQHHGDACPGSAIRIDCDDVDAVIAALPKDYGFARPGMPELQPWGRKEITLTDPSGNRVTFVSRETFPPA